ncbi:hypothetical protein VTN77DRAFT_3592 [Rasamsonia byssochlamydoides]|uniref:uncharacterized protein n=1 Tax=Rasamsonia byssochlamydoides TaxID=89139 RepID=UPI003742EE0B
MSSPLPPDPSDPNASNQSLGDTASTQSHESSQSSRADARRISFMGEDVRRKSSGGESETHAAPQPESLTGKSGVQTAVREAKPAKRLSSPPPPSTYQRGVSFDTFDNRDATDFSFTLNYKHKNYQASRRSRTFLCGTDHNDYSEFALEWLIDELVDDGDEVVCLRVVEKDSKIASDASVEEGRYRKEAEKLLQQVVRKNRNDEKAISLVLELAVGKVQEIIQRMIQIYEPAVLIVGTRGRSLSGMQGLLPGSVSKYCLQHSPIPVIVVRPSPKREKKKKKRLADPTRRSYNNILQLSEKRGSGLFDTRVSTDSNIDKLPDEEAAAVAEAVGLPRRFRHNNSDSKVSTVSKEASSKGEDEPGHKHEHEHKHDVSTAEPLQSPVSPVDSVLKSPTLGGLFSPGESENEDDTGGDKSGGDKSGDKGETSLTTTAAAAEPESSVQESASSVVTEDASKPEDGMEGKG